MPIVCAVIITRNAPEDLDLTLRSLTRQSWLDHIVVSDDSDRDFHDKTADVAGTYGASHVSGPKRGPTPNRINGLRYALSDLPATHVVFADDDMTISEKACESLGKLICLYPNDILCPLVEDGSNGPLYHPGEVNWRGFRSRYAPENGGYGLSDNFMIWPSQVALDVDWDDTFIYGYSEAWVGYQAKRNGTNIRILKDVVILHRHPGRNSGGLDKKMVEPARVYYNFLIKRESRGPLNAFALLLGDALWTSSTRILRGQNAFGLYGRLMPVLLKRWSPTLTRIVQ